MPISRNNDKLDAVAHVLSLIADDKPILFCPECECIVTHNGLCKECEAILEEIMTHDKAM